MARGTSRTDPTPPADPGETAATTVLPGGRLAQGANGSTGPAPGAPRRESGQVPPIPAERVVARLRPHARAMFWPSVVLIAVAGAYGYLQGRFPQQWAELLVAVGALLLVLLLFLIPLASWLSKRFIVTTRRVVVRRGFLVRVRQELLHSRGYEVQLRQNPLQMMFRTGTLRIAVGGDVALVLRDVPAAKTVQGALHDLMENAATLQTAQRQVMQTPAFTNQTTIWTGR